MSRLTADWDIFQSQDRNHVIPRFDTRPHDPVPHCWCMPRKENELYIHHAADGRDPFQVGTP